MLTAVTVVSAFFFMEFIAWSNHKYIMHGFLWSVHRDHHENLTRGIKKNFERNDLFFIVYALPAMVLIIAGFSTSSSYMVAAGSGFTLYGIANFTVHDVLYHRRFNLFRGEVTNRYLKGAIRAHDAHHRPKSSDDFNVFSLLIYPKRFFSR